MPNYIAHDINISFADCDKESSGYSNKENPNE